MLNATLRDTFAKRLRVLARVIVCSTLGLTPTALYAAQFKLLAAQDDLLEKIETLLPQLDVTVMEQANTNRFALVYAQHSDGSFVTISLRQLPKQETHIDLNTARIRPTTRRSNTTYCAP